MKAIRIYVEGGGDAGSKDRLRIAFGRLLERFQLVARRKRLGWRVIAMGSRSETVKHFLSDFRL